jgi:hypothetical protein
MMDLHPHGCIAQNSTTDGRLLEKTTTAAALHLISRLYAHSSHYSGGVELQGPRAASNWSVWGRVAFDAFSARGRHASYFNNGFVLLPSAVCEMNRPRLLWRAEATLKPLYAQPTRDRPLFTFRISTMKTCACVYMRLQEMFFRLCVFFFVVCAHDTARGTRLIVCSFNLSEIITSRLVSWTHFLSLRLVIYGGHCPVLWSPRRLQIGHLLRENNWLPREHARVLERKLRDFWR